MLWSVLAIVLLLAGVLAWRSNRKYTLFKQIGIPGPTPKPFIGNLADFKNGIYECHKKWKKMYGNVVGVFFGGRPAIMIADLDFLEQVLVKQFGNFSDREYTPLRPELLQNDVISLQGQRWKAVRSVMSSSFSNSKLRKMMPLVESKINDMIVTMSERCKDSAIDVDMYREIDPLSLGIVAQCAYGADLDPKDIPSYSKASKAFFHAFKKGYLPMTLTAIIPWVEPLLQWLGCSIHSLTAVNFFESKVLSIHTQRRTDPDKMNKDYPDFLALMTRSLRTEADETSKGKNGNDRLLSEKEVLAGCISFFTGNSDTTQAAMSFTIGLLAIHPEVQDRLVDEVDEVTEGRDTITQEDIGNMTYMGMVVRESLRLYPPVIKCNRTSKEECVIQGYTIPRDVAIEVPIMALHHDPELWPEPNKFDPERFSVQNRAKIHPMAFLPFGGGPRKCIGQRFAMMEIHMVLSRLLQNFRFERSPETEESVVFGKGGLIYPLNGTNIRLRQRFL